MYTMCPPGCYHNGFMATPELGHRMYGYTLLDWNALWSHKGAQTASIERSNMPIVNTFYEALHPIQRVLKLYEQWA